MNATHYFVYTGHSTQTKNKLQEEFMAYLRGLQGTLVKAKDLIKLQNEIKAKAQELNEKYKRCQPLVLSFSNLYTKNGYTINGFHFLTFQVIQAYERY